MLVTTNPDANRHDIVGWAHNHGVSELAIPRRIICVDDIPVLGTGKTDFVQVQKMVAGRFTRRLISSSAPLISRYIRQRFLTRQNRKKCFFSVAHVTQKRFGGDSMKIGWLLVAVRVRRDFVCMRAHIKSRTKYKLRMDVAQQTSPDGSARRPTRRYERWRGRSSRARTGPTSHKTISRRTSRACCRRKALISSSRTRKSRRRMRKSSSFTALSVKPFSPISITAQ
ncbi:MAG: hypothetical protein WDM89_07710 [Rhizomicrobium sp.]